MAKKKGNMFSDIPVYTPQPLKDKRHHIDIMESDAGDVDDFVFIDRKPKVVDISFQESGDIDDVVFIDRKGKKPSKSFEEAPLSPGDIDDFVFIDRKTVIDDTGSAQMKPRHKISIRKKHKVIVDDTGMEIAVHGAEDLGEGVPKEVAELQKSYDAARGVATPRAGVRPRAGRLRREKKAKGKSAQTKPRYQRGGAGIGGPF